jgi:hypothetical protein
VNCEGRRDNALFSAADCAIQLFHLQNLCVDLTDTTQTLNSDISAALTHSKDLGNTDTIAKTHADRNTNCQD